VSEGFVVTRKVLMTTKPIPSGFHTVTPHLVIRNAAGAIDFYKNAFGAKELFRMPGPEGKGIMHAEIKIGDSIIMIGDEFPQYGCKSPQNLNGTPVAIHLYVENVDDVFQCAVKAGAESLMPVQDMFWGDRYGKLKDPFGHEWSVATHKRDLTPDEMQKGAAEAFAKMGAK
jgi:PhnB protein